MNPDLEMYLQDAFKTMQPTNPKIARVMVEPEYESGAAPADAAVLRDELSSLLAAFGDVGDREITTHAGEEVTGLESCQNLHRVVRRITLHADREDGPWVEIAPPGNWI